MRKIIAVFLCICALVSALPVSVYADDPPAQTAPPGLSAFIAASLGTPYEDVSKEDSYYTATASLAAFNLVHGNPPVYRLHDNLTYAEALSFAVRLYQRYNGKTKITGTSDKDLAADPWWDPYVKKAASYKFQYETPADWNAAATKSFVINLLYQAFPDTEYAPNYTVTTLPDVPADAAYAKAVLAFWNAGIIDNNGTISEVAPNAPITRGAAAILIYRMFTPTSRIANPLDVKSLAAFSLDMSGLENPYDDINENDVHYQGALYCKTLGIISGTGERTLSPTDTIAEKYVIAIAASLYERYHYMTKDAAVSGDGYERAERYGLINNGEFKQETAKKPMTWANAILLLSRVLDPAEFPALRETAIEFPDVPDDAPYKQALDMFTKAGVVIAEPFAPFHPNDAITRAELAALVMRVLMPSARHMITTTELKEKLVIEDREIGNGMKAIRYGTGANLLIITFGSEEYGRNSHYKSGRLPYPDGKMLAYYAEELFTGFLEENSEIIISGNWTVYVLSISNTVTTPAVEQTGDEISTYRQYVTKQSANTIADSTGDMTMKVSDNQAALCEFAKTARREASGKAYILDVKGWTSGISTTGANGPVSESLRFGFTAFPEMQGDVEKLDGTAAEMCASYGYNEVCMLELPAAVLYGNKVGGKYADSNDILYQNFIAAQYTRASSGEQGSVKDCFEDAIVKILSSVAS